MPHFPPSALPIGRRRLLLLGAAEALTACGRSGPSGRGLTVGYQRSGVLLLAKVRGVVAAALAPTVVKWVEFPSGPPLLEALNAGAVDFGATGDAPPIFSQAAAGRLRYVAVQPLTGEGEALIVPKRSPLHQVADLRGRRIAFTKASSSHLLVLKALARSGLTLKDVDPVYLSPSDAASALAQGSLDAWAIWDPYLAFAERDQGVRTLVSGRDLARSDAFYLASEALIDEAPMLLSQFLMALRQEAAWGRDHRAELVKIVAGGSGLPADIVDASLRRGPFSVEPMTSEVIARQQASADLFQSAGVIPGRVTVADATWKGWTAGV